MNTIKRWMILLLLTPLWITQSCNKFLDVSANDQVLQETIFKNGEGIRIAVNGVYRLLSTNDMYGKNLSWGVISAMGYNYDYYYLPYEMRDAAQFNYESSSTQASMEEIWKKSYNILANCNNIIQEVEKKDTSIFAEGGNEKNMILGEMYGLRAMIHFELLRIFAPAPASGYAGQTIPYVNSYPNYQPARLDMPTMFTKIIEDMTKAQAILAPIDTIYLRTTLRSNVGRIKYFNTGFPIPQGDFFNYRCQRMNFFAATALLARINMYKGDYQQAYTQARIVYDAQKRNWFQWTSSIYQGQITDVDYIYTKRPDELILAFSNSKNYDNWDQIINSNGGQSQFFRMNDDYMSKLFEGDLDDFRYKAGWYNRYNDFRYITWVRPKGTSYNAEQTLKNQGPLLPAIRFSEMYHILIECLLRQNNVGDAVPIFNNLRINRGAKQPLLTSASASQLMELLVKDIVKESLTEGQTFFLFKRLNRSIFNGETDRVMQPKDWYAPLPLSETAYML